MRSMRVSEPKGAKSSKAARLVDESTRPKISCLFGEKDPTRVTFQIVARKNELLLGFDVFGAGTGKLCPDVFIGLRSVRSAPFPFHCEYDKIRLENHFKARQTNLLTEMARKPFPRSGFTSEIDSVRDRICGLFLTNFEHGVAGSGCQRLDVER